MVMERWTEPRRLTLTVEEEQDGQTVDTLLRRTLRLSGTSVKRAKRAEDGIRLDGVPVYVTARAAAGQVLSVLVGDTEGEIGLTPTPGDLPIVYEDGDLLLLDKPAGRPVHPGPGHFDDTIGNLLTYYYKKTGQTVKFRPVNRLDRGTSGLMCAAKHAHAHERLKEQLHSSAFRRIYLAVCDGVPPEEAGTVDAPIGRAEGSLLAREVRPDGAPARTRYQVLGRHQGRSLLRLELDTGRTHQIRVHMAWLGCPLTGDFLYGTEDRALIGRTALHSAGLSLIHPVTGAPVIRTSLLPADMAALIGPLALEAAGRIW